MYTARARAAERGANYSALFIFFFRVCFFLSSIFERYQNAQHWPTHICSHKTRDIQLFQQKAINFQDYISTHV